MRKWGGVKGKVLVERDADTGRAPGFTGIRATTSVGAAPTTVVRSSGHETLLRLAASRVMRERVKGTHARPCRPA